MRCSASGHMVAKSAGVIAQFCSNPPALVSQALQLQFEGRLRRTTSGGTSLSGARGLNPPSAMLGEVVIASHDPHAAWSSARKTRFGHRSRRSPPAAIGLARDSLRFLARRVKLLLGRQAKADASEVLTAGANDSEGSQTSAALAQARPPRFAA